MLSVVQPGSDPVESAREDLRLQWALASVHAYVDRHIVESVSDVVWWESFETFYAGLTRSLASGQQATFEIAVDTALVQAGMQSWSLARAALEVRRCDAMSARAGQDAVDGRRR